MNMVTLEQILAEAERAFKDLPKMGRGMRNLPEPGCVADIAAVIGQIAAVIKQNESLPVYGLGDYEDNARLWRVISVLALQQAAINESALKRMKK
jgi:hypothetical protein